MTTVPHRPWGVRRATDCNPLPDNDAHLLTAATIDPVTQLGLYRDLTGQAVHAGPPKHGTQRAQFKCLPTGTGDGSRPGNPDDTKVVEYVPD